MYSLASDTVSSFDEVLLIEDFLTEFGGSMAVSSAVVIQVVLLEVVFVYSLTSSDGSRS